jgi:RNA polymerase sigma-70 factor (ECF subfamily)
MHRPEDTRTNPQLLGRLHDLSDAAAWAEFVRQYGPKVREWCRKQGAQDADADDISQQILLRLTQRMRTFEYDPSRGRFRDWMRKVTQHAWYDLVAGRKSWNTAAGGADDWLANSAKGEDLADELDEQYRMELLQEAIARVRVLVADHTWSAFDQHFLQKQPAKKVAEELSLSVTNVYQATHRVTQLLKRETERLEGPPAT